MKNRTVKVLALVDWLSQIKDRADARSYISTSQFKCRIVIILIILAHDLRFSNSSYKELLHVIKKMKSMVT